MQRPPEMRWERPKCIGDTPHKRSGHKFTNVGSFAFLFGRCVSSSKGTPPGPTNDLYKLDIDSASEFYWTKIETKDNNIEPSARWHHSATKIDEARIVVFGGFSASKEQQHLNDVWVLNTNNESKQC
mmetsp:Transcript_5482/g.6845  ORF Transcript_5482/g.6845 Transcript_5482/m.6845 type:complete len:127 (-) Transcript_5482:304-684(-)